MDIWYDCEDCIWASNSGKAAAAHALATNHTIDEHVNS